MELSTELSSSWGDQIADEVVLAPRTLVPVVGAMTQRDLELLETSRDGLNLLFKQTTVGAPAPSSFAPGVLKRDPNNPWVSEAGKKRLHVDMTKGDTAPAQSPGMPTSTTTTASGGGAAAPAPTATISTPALPMEAGGVSQPPSASPSQEDGRVIVRGKRKEGAPTNPPLPPPTSFSSLRREGVSFASTLLGGAGAGATTTASATPATATATASIEGTSSTALEGKQKKTRMEGGSSSSSSSSSSSFSSASGGFGMAAAAAAASSSSPSFQWGPLPVIPPALSAALTAAAAAVGAAVGASAPTAALAPIDSATALVGLAWSLGGLSNGGSSGGGGGSGGGGVGGVSFGGAGSVASGGGAGCGGVGEGEEGEEADKSPKQEAEPLTEAKIAARRKQIDLGKSTPEYNNYVAAVPKHMRSQDKSLHPRTPNPERECSKRKYQGMVLKWRTSLHAWDEPAGSGGGGAAQAPSSQQQ